MDNQGTAPPAGGGLAALCRRVDYDRYLMAGFAPPEVRPALLALIAFSYEIGRVREMVSEPMLGQIRLQWWREALDGIYAGTPRAHETVGPLAAAIAGHELPREVLGAMIDAREADLSDEPPADMAALVAYAGATAGALNEMMAVVLAPGDQATAHLARDRGTAWGLAGLMRSVPAHLAGGRVWLPQDSLAAAGFDAERAGDAVNRATVCRMVADVAANAEGILVRASNASKTGRRRARSALLAGPFSRYYLRRLARAGHDPWKPSVESGRLSRLRVLGFAAALGRY